MPNCFKTTILLIKNGLNDKTKTLLIWSAIWILLAAVLASLLNSFSGQDDLEKVLENLPEQLLSAMNISSGYFTQVESFVSGQFLTLYTLLGSIFAVFIGVNSLGDKIESGLITSELNRSLNRFQIIFSRIVVNTIFLLSSGVLIGFFSYLAFSFLTSQDEVSMQYFAMAMLGSFGLQLLGFSFGLFFGLIFSKSAAQSVGGGLVGASWLFNGLKDTEGYPEFAKPLSVFYYFDVVLLREDFILNWAYFAILISISLVLMILSYGLFRRKQIYL